MDKILIISNPNAGQNTAADFVEQLKNVFLDTGREFSVYETKGNDDFGNLVNGYMDDGYDTVAVLGGDGTISKLVNDIVELKTRPNILLIPLGSTNNLAKALDSELNENKILNMISTNHLIEKSIDVGKINEQYFISTVSVGSIPETAWKTDDEIKAKFGSFGYVLEGLQVLNNQQTIDISIETDLESIEMSEVFIVVIGLSNSVFGIPTFFNEAKIDDGKLYMYILSKSDLLTEVSSLVQHVLPNSEDKNSEENGLSKTTSFRQATFNANSHMHFAVDGEKGPTFPVKIGILEKYLTFLVPDKNN